jgi:hypothetical protein
MNMIYVGFEVLPVVVTKTSVFWDIMPFTLTLVSCSTYSLTLKMEAAYSSEMLFDFQQTTQHYVYPKR